METETVKDTVPVIFKQDSWQNKRCAHNIVEIEAAVFRLGKQAAIQLWGATIELTLVCCVLRYIIAIEFNSTLKHLHSNNGEHIENNLRRKGENVSFI